MKSLYAILLSLALSGCFSGGGGASEAPATDTAEPAPVAMALRFAGVCQATAGAADNAADCTQRENVIFYVSRADMVNCIGGACPTLRSYTENTTTNQYVVRVTYLSAFGCDKYSDAFLINPGELYRHDFTHTCADRGVPPADFTFTVTLRIVEEGTLAVLDTVEATLHVTP